MTDLISGPCDPEAMSLHTERCNDLSQKDEFKHNELH